MLASGLPVLTVSAIAVWIADRLGLWRRKIASGTKFFICRPWRRPRADRRVSPPAANPGSWNQPNGGDDPLFAGVHRNPQVNVARFRTPAPSGASLLRKTIPGSGSIRRRSQDLTTARDVRTFVALVAGVAAYSLDPGLDSARRSLVGPGVADRSVRLRREVGRRPRRSATARRQAAQHHPQNANCSRFVQRFVSLPHLGD